MNLLFKISLTIALLFVVSLRGGAQENLVPNPSFEDTINCPTATDQVYNSVGWTNYSDQSPDYFNACSFNGDVDVPNNWGGYQPASSGNAYCALSAFFPSTPNNREIIGSALSGSLSIGTKYYFSMKVNLSINPTSYPTYACNKLGMRVSTIPFSVSSPAPINNFAHVWTDSIITDTTNWTTIFGSFISDSAYTFIALGNFFDDSNTDTIKMAVGTPPFIFAYYYIDDVCVSTDSAFAANYVYTGIQEEQLNDDFNIYPNPVTNYFQINQTFTAPYDLIIYNSLGQQLYQEKNITTNNKTIDTTPFSKGILFIIIKSNNQFINYKLLKQ